MCRGAIVGMSGWWSEGRKKRKKVERRASVCGWSGSDLCSMFARQHIELGGEGGENQKKSHRRDEEMEKRREEEGKKKGRGRKRGARRRCVVLFVFCSWANWLSGAGRREYLFYK